MPHRVEMLMNALLAMCAAVTSLAAWITYAAVEITGAPAGTPVTSIPLSAEPNSQVVIQGTVWDTVALRMVCIMGAMLGSVVSIVVFREKDATLQMTAARFLASGASGVVFTPMIMRLGGFDANVDMVLGMAGLVGLLGVGVLKAVAPLVVRSARTKVKRAIGEPDTDV